MNKVTLAWADDNQQFLKSVSRIIIAKEDWLDLIFTAANGIELISSLEKRQPDIVLMDIRMPEMDGIEATKVIREKYPDLKIIAFTEFDFEHNIVEMNKVGVKSFIAKSQAEDLIRAISIVHEGGVFFPDEVADILQRYIRRSMTQESNEIVESPVLKINLSPQEMKLVQLLKLGKTSKEIAVDLDLTVSTVRTYRERLLKKTSTKNVVELLNFCHTIKKS